MVIGMTTAALVARTGTTIRATPLVVSGMTGRDQNTDLRPHKGDEVRTAKMTLFRPHGAGHHITMIDGRIHMQAPPQKRTPGEADLVEKARSGARKLQELGLNALRRSLGRTNVRTGSRGADFHLYLTGPLCDPGGDR